MPWAWWNLEELGKLGRGFSIMDDLEKVDIGDGVIPRPAYVSLCLNTSQKQEIIELLRAYTCCFAWDYNEMPSLSRELIEHQLPIKASFRPYKQPGTSSQRSLEGWRRCISSCKLGSYSHVAMQIGFLTSSLWRRRTRGRYGYAWTLETSTEPLQRMSTRCRLPICWWIALWVTR
jgi:hypothetical protein